MGAMLEIVCQELVDLGDSGERDKAMWSGIPKKHPFAQLGRPEATRSFRLRKGSACTGIEILQFRKAMLLAATKQAYGPRPWSQYEYSPSRVLCITGSRIEEPLG